MRQYFFDVSGVLEYLRHGTRFTGIQRVVVTLADAACRKLAPDQAFISYLDQGRGTYVAVPYAALDGGFLTDPDLLRAVFGIRPHRMVYEEQDLRKKYQGRPFRAAFHAMRFRIYVMLGREKYRHRVSLVTQDVQATTIQKIRGAEQIPFDSFAKPGDHLVVMDAVWGMQDVLTAFKLSKKRGILVHTMLHDLIPVVAPHFTNNETLRRFEPWLSRSHDYTSSYLAVSQSTGRDLSAFLSKANIPLPVRITPLAQAPLPRTPQTGRSVTVGHVLEETVTSEPFLEVSEVSVLYDPGFASERIRAVLAHPYVLCVGTLEIRKNVWKIAQVWQRLSNLDGLALPKLVFAGQRGWMIQDFDRMMEATGYLSGLVDVIEKASDAELQALYKHSLFTITASHYEGWGLPIGESLAYGKTAVVSKTSSMPEVGGDMVEYCDPSSIPSILQACRRLIEDPERRKDLEARISTAALRQWDDAADDLLSALASHAVEEIRLEVPKPTTSVELSSRKSESDGCDDLRSAAL